MGGGRWGRRRWLPVGLLPAFAGLLTGCTPDNFGPSGDPLRGGAPVRSPAVAAGTDRPGGAAVPSLPAASPSGTPAALAGAGRGPLDPAGVLRIGSGNGTPDAGGAPWRGQGQGAAGVALERPQPLTGGAVPLEPKPTPGLQLASNVTGATFEQLQAQLAARGAVWQRLEASAESGEWKYGCAVPLRENPNMRKVYEKKAGDPLSAMRGVLDAIDKER